MRVTTERLENCQANVIIELDAAEIDQKLRETARQLSRKATVPGYRRGKAPFQAVIRTFGRELVQQQVIEDFGQELYDQAMEQVELQPFQVGELQEVEWDPFRMKVLLPLRPEVDLGDYRAVRVQLEIPPVTEEQVAGYLAQLQQQNAQWVPVERPVALGDQVVVDVRAAVEEQSFLTQENLELIIQEQGTTPLPGFHEQVVGMSAGEDKSCVLQVPQDYPDARVAGQEALVQVHLRTAKQQDLPPLDDELAMMIGDYDTLEALRIGVRERLENDSRQAAEAEYLDKALDAFVQTASKIEYPPQAVDREVALALDRMEGNLASSGIQLDAFLRMIGKTREAYRQEMRPGAEARLKKRLVLEAIAHEEKLQVEPAEVEAELERLREVMTSEADEMMKTLDTPGGRLMLGSDLLTAKAQERAIQIAKGEAPERPSEPVEASEQTSQVAEPAAPVAESTTEVEPETSTQSDAGPAAVPEAQAVAQDEAATAPTGG